MHNKSKIALSFAQLSPILLFLIVQGFPLKQCLILVSCLEHLNPINFIQVQMFRFKKVLTF